MFPCKGCTDRQIGCHSTCQRYQDAKKDWDEIAAEAKERDRLAAELDDYQLRVAWKIGKRYKRMK